MTLLVVAEMCAMSLWFTAAAIMPDMIREGALDPDPAGVDDVHGAGGFRHRRIAHLGHRPRRSLRSAADRGALLAWSRRGQRGAVEGKHRRRRRDRGALCHRRAARRRLSGRHEDRDRLGLEGPRHAGRHPRRRAHPRLGVVVLRSIPWTDRLAQRRARHLADRRGWRPARVRRRPRAAPRARAAFFAGGESS